MKGVEISEYHVAFCLTRVGDPQVIRVGIHGADRTVDLLFAGRKGERVPQRFRHFGVAIDARQAADVAEQRFAVL